MELRLNFKSICNTFAMKFVMNIVHINLLNKRKNENTSKEWDSSEIIQEIVRLPFAMKKKPFFFTSNRFLPLKKNSCFLFIHFNQFLVGEQSAVLIYSYHFLVSNQFSFHLLFSYFYLMHSHNIGAQGFMCTKRAGSIQWCSN